MKDSGVEWIGEIPEDWEIIKVKQLFKIGRGRVIAKTELDEKYPYPVYSSQTKNDGILGYIQTYDFEGPRLTWTTDGANAGTVFIRDGKYNCTNVCGTLELKDEINDLQYLKYTLEYIAIFHKRADTNGYKIMNNEMANIEIVLPSEHKQKAIADFLDKKVSEIDNIIFKTKKAIEEYKRYKQSLITETVTKGLDENVQMKDSGIEWIGEIPGHWDLVKINRVTRSYSGGTPSRDIKEYWENGDINWMSSGEVNDRIIYDTKEKITKLGLINSSANYFPVNTVMVALNGQGKTKGMSAILKVKTTANQSLVGFICFEDRLDYRYLNYCFITSYSYNRSYLAGGNKRDGIAAGELKQSRIPLPNIFEQEQIASYLDKKTNQIDQIISSKEKLLREMEAYKKSLIYETVTGKREVK